MTEWIVLGVAVVGALVLMTIYNGLVRGRNQAENAWNQIDVQLKRRHDLVPNLVETTKGYLQHERETLEAVTRARTSAQGAGSRSERIAAEGALGQALANLYAVSESYPDLKSNQSFLALQEELTSTENKIAFARQHYNDSVMSYNSRRQEFPAVALAGTFGFEEESYWAITDDAEREAPRVKL
jgi:LemA protein